MVVRCLAAGFVRAASPDPPAPRHKMRKGRPPEATFSSSSFEREQTLTIWAGGGYERQIVRVTRTRSLGGVIDGERGSGMICPGPAGGVFRARRRPTVRIVKDQRSAQFSFPKRRRRSCSLKTHVFASPTPAASRSAVTASTATKPPPSNARTGAPFSMRASVTRP